ncbi:hypothetical protein LEP1GSC151_3558 [Leptospira interrogans serovar Grippotyphosa str. LT2186]|uniref:Uncharacterized protein n=2 Tax=Leptospira interrogans TaxID=173 RepID=M3HJI2_LEPIR|nr:hypothetical protein LEP1GSC151_3558 [Leptospira interrogans serovar Grippotyphosa str. LT2186]EMM94991.1 hypothetical protein LEP1GSC158_2085 [Leptospira interrogans serovar Zanoni str. LT2156]
MSYELESKKEGSKKSNYEIHLITLKIEMSLLFISADY